ncbi:bifunctional 4-hydroxy-2-oxoglutarate aldolase/2-dehydro-3-deoxy-phosphogluconate aldolase [Microbacterium oryzae]|uniref:bifunctional 4-hydroxy-2-oxoglutarate aldolase/2-dehydro-3-deoxy-phosphogluconate aldolase n=1 Tax=Microbacterium oryzae TaxID=743009 RepID=UPI0025B0BBC6|nr:bifunctional 4-hydroxy-2-oxoglutarate aldolase/2-dehydro-3-deoxy-phosphogluconate aldolase [Microbacterium oryzae]MDN3312015.1 bifunctional 4-hydroxy-2-oxoglutarate aldolase/2-dehydro-3-deoxy-phosphogluconate aldolase [Microbacterium oryzae]
MIDNEWFAAGFAASPYMAILRGLGADTTLELAAQAWSAGVELVEVPVQRPEDLEALSALLERGRAEGHPVGAGTVRTPEQLDAVASAGADFVVTPGFSPAIIRAAAERGIPALPGVATASEVDAGLQLGLTWLKAFPASVLGSAWITQMHGPFPEARFVATGGMSLSNAPDFLEAGARGVAIGSAVRDLASHSR